MQNGLIVYNSVNSLIQVTASNEVIIAAAANATFALGTSPLTNVTLIDDDSQGGTLDIGGTDTQVFLNQTFNSYSGGLQYVASAAVASATILNGGNQEVFSGGMAYGTSVENNGVEYVAYRGSAGDSTIGAFGYDIVYSNGNVSGTVVNAFGSEDLDSGGGHEYHAESFW